MIKVFTEIQQRVIYMLAVHGDGKSFINLVDLIESNPNSAQKAINELIEQGILREEREAVFPRRRLIYFTEKGKKIAEIMKQLLDYYNSKA